MQIIVILFSRVCGAFSQSSLRTVAGRIISWLWPKCASCIKLSSFSSEVSSLWNREIKSASTRNSWRITLISRSYWMISRINTRMRRSSVSSLRTIWNRVTRIRKKKCSWDCALSRNWTSCIRFNESSRMRIVEQKKSLEECVRRTQS